MGSHLPKPFHIPTIFLSLMQLTTVTGNLDSSRQEEVYSNPMGKGPRAAAQESCSHIRVPVAQGEALRKIMFLLDGNSLNIFLIPEEKSLLTNPGSAETRSSIFW